MGCGKSRIALEAIRKIHPDSQVQPVVIVCKGNSVATWEREITKWVSRPYIMVAVGKPELRESYWREFSADIKACNTPGYDGPRVFLITTYESLHRDSQVNAVRKVMDSCGVWIADEWHKVRNHKSVMYKSLKHVTRAAKVMIPITGTLMRNGPQDAWTALNWVNRKLFSSYWKFVGTWCITDNTGYGKEIIGPRNLEKFHKLLLEHMAYISEEEVEPHLPKKNRIVVPIEPTPQQRWFLEGLDEELIGFIRDTNQVRPHMVVAPGVLARITRQRQMLCCPRIFPSDVAGPGAALEHIKEKLEEHFEVHHTLVIFMPFADALRHVKSYIASHYPELLDRIYILRGGLKQEEVKDILWKFRQEGGILLCSISYAESFDLEFVKVAYFLGYDWSPDVNRQAEDRLRRLTSDAGPVTIYYMQYRDTIDGHVLDILNDKHRNVEASTPPLELYMEAQERLKIYGRK